MTNNEKSNLYEFYQDFAKQVRALAAAFSKVEKYWEICQDLEDEYKSSTDTFQCCNKYPFDKSFDELTLDVLSWRDEVENWVNNIVPQELGL